MEKPAGSSMANVVDMTRFGADAPVVGSGASPACTASVFGPLSLILGFCPAMRTAIISAR